MTIPCVVLHSGAGDGHRASPERLSLLAIIVPAILLLIVMYGRFNRWVNQRTHPMDRRATIPA